MVILGHLVAIALLVIYVNPDMEWITMRMVVKSVMKVMFKTGHNKFAHCAKDLK